MFILASHLYEEVKPVPLTTRAMSTSVIQGSPLMSAETEGQVYYINY